MQDESPATDAQARNDDRQPRQFRAGPPHRLSGKMPPLPSSSSRLSLYEASPSLYPQEDAPAHAPAHAPQPHRRRYYSEKLLEQVSDWLQRERRKAAFKATKVRHRKSPARDKRDASGQLPPSGRERADSAASDTSEVSFDRLQRILEDSMASFGLSSIPRHATRSSLAHHQHHRHPSGSRSGLQRTASSDTDYIDGDVIVPGCDVWLDNTKALGYVTSPAVDEGTAKEGKDREAWVQFKNDIVRIAHTLRLKGWRRVPLDSGDSIEVKRLSGALTNAVYVVMSPARLPEATEKKAPLKILLRIYGPQVEHLIDRENELKVLQRLARKKIGPRLLGTFQNGRFEQYFDAAPLNPKELRDAETSRQIAKRMRELHDGIELLPQERENGPAVWRNLDQWRDNVARIVKFLDRKLESHAADGAAASNKVIGVHAWLANGYVCGLPWDQFIRVVDRYRAYINSVYRERAIKDRLVFAHNDTQYGNILRMRPDDEKSPLLQAANKHKQLVVIDFEYAAANVPGLDFCNHFTEWAYNYHDPVAAWVCNTLRYPTPEQQHRFVKAYVDHRPQFPSASATPRMAPQDRIPSGADILSPASNALKTGSASSLSTHGGGGSTSTSTSSPPTHALAPVASTSSIVDFMLDARAPQGGDWSAFERAREEKSEEEVKELLEEARLWRAANTAMWVAWGIVQAKIPGLEDDGKDDNDNDGVVNAGHGTGTPPAAPVAGSAEPPVPGKGKASRAGEEEEGKGSEELGVDEFDYLSYAQDRALFFWGDVVQLGLVKREDLPESLRMRLKIVEY